MNVYIVTSGSYSDYSINCVFSTREKAQEWLDSWKPRTEYGGGSDYEIEEWDMDAEPKATPRVKVTMDKHGTPLKAQHYQGTGPRGFRWFCSSKGQWINAVNAETACLQWVVETDDDTRAIKVTNEKRTQILAQNLWGDDVKVQQLFGQEVK